jgi:hypothetical protein
LAVEIEIVGEAALAGDQPLVLFAEAAASFIASRYALG